MRFQVPIDTLFTQVFGIAAPLIRKHDYNVQVEPYQRDPDDVDTVLGTLHQFPMSFEGGHYNVMSNGIIEDVFRGGMMLPYTSVASFSRAKRVTKTYMSGKKGGVIEQYGFEDWHIRVQGFILKINSDKPEKIRTVADQVKEIQQYEELCDSIKVKGKIFDWLNIYHVAIMSVTYPDARNLDMNVVKPFEMVLESVEPIELIIGV